jgi:hypothetical protein
VSDQHDIDCDMGEDCTCGANANVVRFPIERVLELPAPERGFCGACGVEMGWPTSGAWPESCPNGCTPLIIHSSLPEPDVFTWNVAQGPPMDERSA